MINSNNHSLVIIIYLILFEHSSILFQHNKYKDFDMWDDAEWEKKPLQEGLNSK